ncbi:hypothetical protein [Streptomyces sp. C1-2]|uniref:DUF6907 domain-containing protein n=1 Tax=Streptomyces sp. C1-2 TaxID=2720022 RepID=UPI00143257D7|nr:hypothetical protein [Streptomyces sp. C1-2]NJP72522.1 hypothetical protein [Streptomyces sp. C1-2]
MSTITAGRDRSTPLPFVCPPWCAVDHAAQDVPRFPGDRDVIHRSAEAWLTSAGSVEAPWELSAHLASPELEYGPATLVVDIGVPLDPYSEMDVEQADQFIRDLKAFTSRVQQMRDRLAAMKEQQS